MTKRPATLVEKILARASNADSVAPGDVVWAWPDIVTVPEVSFPAYVKRLRDNGIPKLARPETMVVVIDHEVPVHSKEGAERNRLTRQLAQETDVAHLFDGEGITHPLVVERGLITPGMFVAGADTHTSSIGGAGAFAVPFGFEVTMIMAIGKIWVQVPETIRIDLTGHLAAGVTARDLVLSVMQQIDADFANYRVIEFGGPGLSNLSVQERMTLCGLCIDMGAKTAIAEADAVTERFLKDCGIEGVSMERSDPDCVYAARLTIDLAELSPRVSMPPLPSNVSTVIDLPDTPIQHAYIGSCASGTLAELTAAADILDGHTVHPSVQLLVIPATRRIHQQALEQGVLTRLMRAGAVISPSTCGPCFGGLAQLADGETRISTSTRNDSGRMGSRKANIYLGSASTVAASAIVGRITDPRNYVKGGSVK
ncbi:MAG TPA: homoaconitate hydratase family protein [Rhodospirillaceae bacterium]|nr:homoaconitate hydratase [Rhodospirillaceae bacterium]MAX62668.1 homoaconitate hydratase [Rhodospirillaceae bacterium]HBM14197.1 homoaconitate hydratase family protein [Rhodospirillaceae bacterium]|tara:strand:+ start:80453 stop:81730 length:1278 start_codon:yes stop_codon:yes gene_type:complete